MNVKILGISAYFHDSAAAKLAKLWLAPIVMGVPIVLAEGPVVAPSTYALSL